MVFRKMRLDSASDDIRAIVDRATIGSYFAHAR